MQRRHRMYFSQWYRFQISFRCMCIDLYQNRKNPATTSFVYISIRYLFTSSVSWEMKIATFDIIKILKNESLILHELWTIQVPVWEDKNSNCLRFYSYLRIANAKSTKSC